MNVEIIKAMNKKDRKSNQFRKWWNKNEYKVMRVVLFPLWWGIKAKEKINAHFNSKCGWDEERANEILSYYVPRMAQWDAEEKCFYFADNGMGWGMKSHQKKIKLRDRRWWNCNRGFWGGQIRTYLIEKFEMDGFTKEIGDNYDNWTEIAFYLNEK